MVAKVVEWHFQMNLINDNLFKSLESFKKYLVIIWSVKRYSKLLTFWYKGAILNDLPSARNLIMKIRHLGTISVENVILPVQGTGISIIKIRWSLDHLIFSMGFPYVEKWSSQIAKYMGPTWGPPGSCRPQMGPCWPHEPCYQGCAASYFIAQDYSNEVASQEQYCDLCILRPECCYCKHGSKQGANIASKEQSH